MEKQVLTEQELEKLQNFQKDYQSIQFEFGEIEIIKARLEGRSELIKSTLKKTQEEETQFTKELQEKYGEITLNLETGEFSKLEQNT